MKNVRAINGSQKLWKDADSRSYDVPYGQQYVKTRYMCVITSSEQHDLAETT